MAKRIIWSVRAKQEKKNILKYWLNRNKSNVYPKKLDRLFKIAIKSLAESHMPRKKTNDKTALVKIVKDYLIIFEEDESNIYILSIWDSRQDHDKLKKVLD